MDQPSFHTNVVTGPALLALSENVRSWRKRDCYGQLNAYLHSTERDRVCLLYGLRRTGKTTLLRQAVLDMSPEDAAQTAYIKATAADTMAVLNRDMEQLRALGFRYVLLDEVTLIRDFIDSAALLSDVYAAQGMKIVLSGTYCLGFWFALHQELYDRAKTIHTTFIPYREHSRLLGVSGIDEYIRYGGTSGLGNWPLRMRRATRRTLLSGMMSQPDGTSTPPSAKTFSTPWPAVRTAGTFAIFARFTRLGN